MADNPGITKVKRRVKVTLDTGRFSTDRSLLRLVEIQLLAHRLVCLLLRLAPGPALIDEPVFLNRRPADLSFAATLLDNLEITVPGFLIAIFHPKTRAIHDVGQFFGVARQK